MKKTEKKKTANKDKQPKKGIRWVIVAVAVFCVAAIIGGVLYFRETPDTTPTYEPGSAEETALKFVEAYYTRDRVTWFAMTYYNSRQRWEEDAINDHGSAEAFYTYVQNQADERGLDVEIHSFDDYFNYYHQFILNDLKETYGDNYTLTTAVKEITAMDKAKIDDLGNRVAATMEDKYFDTAGLADVTEGYIIDVNIQIHGPKKDFSESYLVYVINYDGHWKVVEHTA